MSFLFINTFNQNADMRCLAQKIAISWGVAGFISRRATQIVEKLLEIGIDVKKLRAELVSRLGEALAIRGETHPCNENLDRLLCLA